jgi:hypothetical protein
MTPIRTVRAKISTFPYVGLRETQKFRNAVTNLTEDADGFLANLRPRVEAWAVSKRALE